MQKTIGNIQDKTEVKEETDINDISFFHDHLRNIKTYSQRLFSGYKLLL